MDPRALTRYYELCLGLRTGNSGANGSLKRRNWLIATKRKSN